MNFHRDGCIGIDSDGADAYLRSRYWIRGGGVNLCDYLGPVC